MKASAFDYVRVRSVDEAIACLTRHGEGAKILAGGQSLLPALNLRLLAPEILVDISDIAALRSIAVEQGRVRIGALARHADVLASDVIASNLPLLSAALPYVAHPAIRNRGTIGGNLAHADPASELPACMMALGADLILAGPEGERRIAADGFFTGIYETALRPNELVVAIEIDVQPASQRVFFDEYARRLGDYAIVGIAAVADVTDGVIERLKMAYFAVGSKATLASKAASRIVGQSVTPDTIADAQSALADDLDPQDDQQASGAMRLHLARTLLGRCVSSLAAIEHQRSTAA